jgi:hypothetical protein
MMNKDIIMDIRVKAALRMSAVFGAGLLGAGLFYFASSVVSEAVFFGVIAGCFSGIFLYNAYRIFLSIEEMKERNKK